MDYSKYSKIKYSTKKNQDVKNKIEMKHRK